MKSTQKKPVNKKSEKKTGLNTKHLHKIHGGDDADLKKDKKPPDVSITEIS